MATYQEAELLARAALEWALGQLSGDARLPPLARGAEGPPLHVLARSALAVVGEHLAAAPDEPVGDGPDDKRPSQEALRRAHAALEFAYARALDVALDDPTPALEDADAVDYFEPGLRRAAVSDLARLRQLLDEARTCLPALEGLAAATREHLSANVATPKHSEWLENQLRQMRELSSELDSLRAKAQGLATDLTFDPGQRSKLPYTPLLGLSRREQQRVLLADALLLHETFGLSETEIGAIWGDNPPERAEAKRHGGKVLARARKTRN